LTTEKRPNEWRPVIRAALIGVTLFGLDAVCSGQGFFAVLVAFVAIVVQVGLAIRNAVNGRWRPVTRHLAACGVYALSFLLVWTYILTDRDGAARRAEKLITACHAYEAKYGRYPEHLGELVPEFVDRIPRARYVVMWGEFDYHAFPAEGAERRHTLKYVVVPPFGRRLYHLEERRWSYLD
jgi:hypothetical protein